MQLYHISNKVLESYRTYVKGNKHVNRSLAMRKLTRNVQLSVKSPLPFKDSGLQMYHYGNLDIVVDPKKHRIVSIRNFKGATVEWFVKDEVKYQELNKEYRIDELEEKLKQEYEVSVGF
jgi:hypothetical protein